MPKSSRCCCRTSIRRRDQVFRASWLADYNDAYSFLQVLQSGFGINLPRYANAEYMHYWRSRQRVDAGRRRALLEHAEEVMIADQPLIPLYFYVAASRQRPVQGWRDNAMNVVYSKQLMKTVKPRHGGRCEVSRCQISTTSR